MSDGAGIQSSWRRGLAFAAIVFAGETIFLLPFILPRLFRPLMLQQWQISNLELGAAMSPYGIVAAISYAFGGPLADRFDAKRLMVTALLATALTGTLMWGRPTPLRLSLAYACFGGTTILLFWSALVRATHELGSRQSRAFAFGIVEAGRGAVAATLGMIATSSWLGTPATDGSQVNASQVTASQVTASQQPSVNMLVTFAILTVIAAAVAIAIGLPRPSSPDAVPPDASSPAPSSPDRSSPAPTLVKRWDRRMMAQVCKNPSVWLQSMILLAAYNGWKCIDLFGVYLTDLHGWTAEASSGAIAWLLWARVPVALLAGWLADRLRPGRLLAIQMIGLLGCSFLLSVTTDPASAMISVVIGCMVFASMAVYAMRSIYFAMFEGMQVSPAGLGTAVGIISCVGFLPDVYFSTLTGYWIDQGPSGFTTTFQMIAAVAAAGATASWIQSRILRLKKQAPAPTLGA